MKTIEAQTILTPTKSRDWFGTDYSMNLYQGCHHGCVYCDSRSYCYGIQNFERVKTKQSAIQLLTKELQGKKRKGVVGTDSMSDPYNSFEKNECLTKSALQMINYYGFGVSVVTKSHFVLRDCELLKKIKHHSPVNVAFSFSTCHDTLAKKIERNVTLPSARLKALQTLATQNIYTGVVLMPVLPYITDDWDSIEQLVQQAKNFGTNYIYPFWGMTLRDRQKAYYFAYLKKYAPHILKKYQATAQTSSFYPIPHYADIKKKFEYLCQKIEMDCTMNNIIANYQANYSTQQLKLF